MDLERVQLTRRLILWQRKRGHRSATDDILCAYAGYAARPDAGSILDLGAGQGSVALMLAGVVPNAQITAVEVQDVSFELLLRNVKENELDARVTPVHADLRTVDLGDRRFDLITGSPPYVRPGAGVVPQDEQRAAARFELRGGVEDYCEAVARWLSADGRAVLLMDGAQDDRSQRAAAQAGLAVERRVSVHPRAGASRRFVVYQLARPAFAERRADRTLTIRDGEGCWSEEYLSVRRSLDLR